jgi:pimeloyl-ACP methyl ester carboxylesterase
MKCSTCTTAVALAVVTVIAGCGSDGTSELIRLSEARGATLGSCADLVTRFSFANTTIDSSAAVASGTLAVAGQPVAEHCLVKGAMHKRTGVDGKTYAIGFEMRLPTAWNGRFFYQGNGGLDGSVSTAVGAFGGGPLTHALAQGFAVISSDAGHTGAQTTAFGFEPVARLDYGYQAVGKLTPMAKDLIKTAYGKGPDRSYIGGCSNGGRHTLVAAARYADQYDGFLAGAPGYNLPKAAVANIWGSQQFAKIMTAGATVVNGTGTLPDLASGFTPTERALVAKKILDKCDALDGLADGLVQDTVACQKAFNLASDVATCSGARDGSCLTTAQKAVISDTFAGPKNSTGAAIYNGFWFDPGIAGNGWAVWKFVNSQALDPLAAGTIFRVPPAFIANSLTVSVDDLAAQIYATNATFGEAGMTFMTPPNSTNLAALKIRGAKIMVYHGVSDPIFSAADTGSWYDGLTTNNNGDASNFARFYRVPGMNHCSGGLAADQFDMLTPLVSWVEKGVAPDAVIASVRGAGNAGGLNAELPADWSATRSRPLCPSPKVAKYSGSGDKESAANFSCQ